MRQAILDAATAEFSAHGLGGARIDQISLRSGSNIYYSFEQTTVVSTVEA